MLNNQKGAIMTQILAKRSKLKKEDRTLLTLTLPFVIYVFAFSYVPLFGWIYAFFDYKPGIPLFRSTFEGFTHFREVFGFASNIGTVLTNTLAMNILGILVSFLPIVFAIMLNEVGNRYFKKTVQTVTTLPNFISWIIVYSFCFSVFSSEGLLNQMLSFLGGEGRTNILADREMTWYFQTALAIWKTTGWSSIIYLAAIAGIDKELYDAAFIDGAGRLKVIRHIVIPGILPTYFVILLLSIGNMLTSNFEQYFVFFNSVIADKIEVVDYYAYRMGIMGNDYPLGTAISMMKSIVSIFLLFSANFMSRRVRGEALF